MKNEIVTFDRDPNNYKHWEQLIEGSRATIFLDVAENEGIRPGYELKLNSYDLGVDIELKKRDINAEKIMYRYFSKIEIENLRNLNVRKLNLEVLKYWVLKEACIKWQEGNLSKDIMQCEII